MRPVHGCQKNAAAPSSSSTSVVLATASRGVERTPHQAGLRAKKSPFRRRRSRMPRSRFALSLSSPRVDVVVDMGNPFLNRAVDGFLTIGTVAATRVAAEETYHCIRRGSISEHKLEESLKKMCREGAYWGTVAGVYTGMEYGIERIRGKGDWKNALLGGTITGALISFASKNNRDKVVEDAIIGGAVATAVKFINYVD